MIACSWSRTISTNWKRLGRRISPTKRKDTAFTTLTGLTPCLHSSLRRSRDLLIRVGGWTLSLLFRKFPELSKKLWCRVGPSTRGSVNNSKTTKNTPLLSIIVRKDWRRWVKVWKNCCIWSFPYLSRNTWVRLILNCWIGSISVSAAKPQRKSHRCRFILSS